MKKLETGKVSGERQSLCMNILINIMIQGIHLIRRRELIEPRKTRNTRKGSSEFDNN